MKKFMIFLLMAFLYLGTCQARSEASHPNNAKLKLLSWVSPTPSESFLTRSDAVNVEGLTISPSSTVFLSVTGDHNSQEFTANYGGGNTNVTAWKWFVDGVKVGNAQSYTYTANAMIVGTHSIYSRAILASGDSVQSPATTIIVNQNDIQVEVVGVTEACEDAEVVLTASIEGTQLQGFQYVWKYQGNVLLHGVNSVQLLNQGQQIKFFPRQLLGGQALENPRELDFTVEISYAGCKLELSPVHYLTVYPTPQLSLVVPEQICATGATVLTAAVTGNTNLTPYQYKWFKKAGDNISDLATTTVPELTVENDSLLNNANWEHVGVAAIYTSAACNTDTVWNQIRPTEIPAPDANALVMKHTLPNEEADTFCLGSQILFTLTDGNTAFGTPTYTWTVNGVPAEATGNMLEFVAEQEGTFYVVVSATYENYPCEVVVADTDTVVINVAPQLYVAGDNVICATGSTTLTATVSPATEIQSYEWTTPSGLVDNNTNSLLANEAGIYTVKAIMRSGCEVIAQFSITQFGADLQVNASEYYACPGSTVALNANADGWENENITYAWFKINGNNVGDTVNLNFSGSTYTATIPADATDSVKYMARATAADGCMLEQVIKVNLMGGPLAKISFVDAKDTTLCAGGQAVLKINDPVTTYNGNYTWYQNGIEIPGANLDSISIALNQAGVYVYSAKRANAASCGNDTVADASVTFTVVDAPVITLTGDNMICQNDSATMTVVPNIANATYKWYGPDAAAANANTYQFTTATPGVYAVTVGEGACQAAAEFTITQFGGNLQVYASDLEVCPGSPVMLNAVFDGFNNQNIAYKWYLNNSVIDSASSIVVYPELANATDDSVHYVVTAYATSEDDANMSTACALTSYINIYVVDTTSANLTLFVAPENLCQGGQIGASVTPQGNANINYYTWFLNGVEVPGQNLDTISLNINEPGDYTIGVKPADNICVAHPATVVNQAVTVYGIPEITMTGNNVICNGDTAEIIAVPVPTLAGNDYTYTWAGPNTTFANDSSLKTVVPGVYTVTVKSDDNHGGCMAMADFTVYQNGGNLQLTPSQTLVCAGEAVVLNANLNGFNGENVVYAWSTQDTASTITVFPTDTTTYAVTAIAGNCVMVDSITIYVAPSQTYTTTVVRKKGSEFCVDQEIAYFEASSDPAISQTPVLYNWYLDGVLIPGDNRNTLFLNNVEIGAHYLTARVVVDGCNSSAMSDAVNFNVHAAPEVTITGNNVVCNGDTAVLTANAFTLPIHPATNNVYTYTYKWNTGAETQSIKVTEDGTYTVTVTNQINRNGVTNLCSSIATIQVTTFGGDLQLTADRTVVCANEPVVLNANLNGFNNENVVYAWNTEAQDTASTITVFPTATTTYVVNAIAGNCNMTDSIKITANGGVKVTATVTSDDDTVCLGEVSHFHANADNDNVIHYIWYVDGVALEGEQLSTLVLTIDQPGIHYVAARPVLGPCDTAIISQPDTVLVNPAPEFTLSGNNILCAGDTAKIYINIVDENTQNYSYEWSNNTSENPLKVTTSGTYTVTVTNEVSKCSSVGSVNIVTTGAQLQILADKTVICDGEYVTLSANFDGFENENASYIWSQVGGDQIGTGSTVTVHPSATTKYALTVNAGECSVVDTIEIIVNQRPADLNVMASLENICEGSQVTLTATAAANATGAAAASYIWYQNGVELAGLNQSAITVNLDAAGSYAFTAKAVSAYGCEASNASQADTVNVFAAPVVTLTGNNVICNGDSAEISVNVLPVADANHAYSYAWNAGVPTNSAIMKTGDAGIYTVTVTNTANQMNCQTVASVNVITTGADMQIIADKTVICEGEYVTLRANFDGFENENASYSWSLSQDGTPSVGTASTLTVNPAVDTRYYLTINAGDCSISDYIDITVHARPEIASVTPSAEYICQGGQVSFVVDPAAANNTYEWFLNGVQIANQGTSTLTLNLNEVGAYQVAARIINEYGCAAVNTTVPMAEHTNYIDLFGAQIPWGTVTEPVVVAVLPTSDVQLSGNNVICNGSEAVITANVIPAVANDGIAGLISIWNNLVGASDFNYEYAWSNGANTQTMTTTAAGIYTVTVTNTAHNLNCYATASVEVTTVGSNLQVYADKMNVCEGEFVELNANINGFVNENATYSWTNEAGAVLDTTSTITVQTVANDNNQAIYNLAVTAGACTIEGYIAINVTPVQTVNTSVSYNGETTLCVGQQAWIFSATSNIQGEQIDIDEYGLPIYANLPYQASQYIWYVDGIEVPGQHLNQIELNLNEIGYHYVSAKAVVEDCYVAVVSPEQRIRVMGAPEVTISGNNIICNGDTATLVAHAATPIYDPEMDNQGMYTYEYAWSNDSTTASIDVTAAGLYTVTVTNATTGCYATASVEVTTLGGDLQLTPSATVVCAGDPVVLNANIDGFNNELVTYEWSTEETASTITVFPTDTTTYVVTAVAGNCTMVDSITIFAATIDTVKVQLASVESICQGGQIKAVATATPAIADYFVWYLNGQQLEGENLDTLVLNMYESGDYYLVSKAIVNGCENAPLSEPVYFTVDSMPVVTITGNQLYTVGSTVATLTASNDYNFQSFVWSNNATGQTIDVNAYGVYTVTATTANGCVAISEPFTVSPVEDLQVHIVGANEACQNDIVTLSAIVDFDLEGHTYQWFVDNNPISGATQSHLVVNVNDLYESTQELAHEFKVEISVPNSGAACHVVASPVHSFLIIPAPMAVVSAPEKVCEGSEVTFEALVYAIGDNAQYQYVWYRDNESNPVDTIDYLTTYTVDFATATEHTHAVKVLYQDHACNSTISQFVGVEVYETPANITMNLDPTTICTTNQANLTITDNNGEETFGVVTYNWFMNGIEMPLVHGNIFTADFDHNGEYTFWATATYSEYPCAVLYTDTVVENVVMHPTVQITGDPIICHDNIVELFANVNDTDDDLDYSYEWRLFNYTVGSQFSLDMFGGTLTFDNPMFLNHFLVAANATAGNTNHFVSMPLEARDYPYIFTVVVTTPEGCRVVSEPYYVYVGEDPEVVVTVDYDTVCATGEITAVAHLGNWNMDNLTAQWQVSTNDGDSWQNIDYGTSGILHHTPGQTSQYRIVVTQTTTGCQATSDPVEVVVVTPQQIHHILAINANTDTNYVCEGAQIEVTALMVQLDENGDPVVVDGDTVYYVNHDATYMWKLNGMELQTIHGAEFSAQAYIYDNDPVYYVYEAFAVYDIPGCEIVPVASDTIFVKRNPIVTIDGNPNVCFFGPDVYNVALTAWVDGDVDQDATYTWFESGQSRPNEGGYDNNYREAWNPTYDNPYIFTVEVTNGDGCTTMSDPFYVNVYERPYVNITGEATQICENGNVTLQANLNNYNDPMLTFQWYRDEVNNTHIVPGATHEVETFEPEVGTTNFIVKVTHLMDYITQYCVAYDTFPVNVVPVPVVTAVNDLNGERYICEGRDVTMNATTTGGVAGGEVYSWYRNGELIQDVNNSIFVDSPVAMNGQPTQYIYSVKVTQSASGCESETFVVDTIMVNPTPVVELVTDPIVCIADAGTNNINMIANVEPAPTSDLVYHWFENNQELDTTHTNAYSTYRPYRDYAYSFSVRLSNDYGCIAESSALVYVNDAPVVNITANDTMMCVGGEVELAAALNDWNADMLTFQWFDNNVEIPGATSLNYAVNPAVGDHNYKVEILQLTSECSATSTPITVHVVADPVIASITENIPENNQVCDGYQVLMTANVQGGVAGGEVYTWYRNGEIIEGATAQVYSEVVSALNGEPTVYKYTVSVAQSAFGCESDVYTGMATFTVNPNPTVEIAYDPIVCVDSNDNVTLVANAYPTNETFTYRWFEDNVEIDTVTGNTLTTTKPFSENAYNFSVMLVNNIACSAVAEAHVMVNAAPVVNIASTEYDICVGGEITLTASLNDWNADMLTFQWFDNNVAIPGATSLEYTVTPTLGEHTYTFKVNQITSACEAMSLVPAVVTVNPLPVVVSVNASQYDVCYGGQITLTATTNVNRNDGVFTWYRNGILMEGATAAVINDTPGTVDNNTQTYVYTAVVTYPQAGCTSMPTSSSVVTVYPNPVVVITGDQHVCETDSIFLIANVDTTGMNVGGLHYTWYESGQIRDNMAYNLGDRNFFAEYMYARTEPYRFTVDVWRDGVDAGCTSHSAEYLVYVYPQPVVNITATETEICENGEVTLTANLNDYNADNITYQWYTVDEEPVIAAIGYDSLGNYIYDTTYVAVNHNIAGATSSTYTTTLTETTTLGVTVLQTNSTCTANNTITITVNPIPVVNNITVNFQAVDTLCNGGQVHVVANTNIDPAELNNAVFTWYRNGVVVEGATEYILSESLFTADNQTTAYYYNAIVTLPASGCVSEMAIVPGLVIVEPAPSTVSISGINVLCENDSTVLTAYSDVPGTFYWSNGDQGNTTTVMAGSYTVTLKTNTGCEMTSAPFVVESFGTDLFVDATPTHICQGEHVTLHVTQDGWQGNVTYQWDANANNSTSTTVDVTPEDTTTYHVVATVNYVNGTCSVEGEVTVIVIPRPAQLTVVASDSVVCEGSQVTFTASGANDAVSYIWYANGNEVPGENQANLTVLFNEAGIYEYSAKAVNDEGCVSAFASAPATVTVNAAPASVAISGNSVICNGGSTLLIANVAPEAPAGTQVVYTWLLNNTPINYPSLDTLRVYTEGSYKVNVSFNGCTTESEAFEVTVEEAPQLQLTATETDICVGGTTVITAEATGWNNGNVNYNWSNGFQGSAYTFVPTAAQAYNFTVTASQSTSGCEAVASITINVSNPPAAPAIVVDNNTICDGGQITLTDTNAVDGAIYTWYRNGSVINGATLSTLTESPVTVDGDLTNYVYTAVVTLPNSGCVSAMSANTVVTVIPAPVAVVSVEGNTTICEGGNTTLHANVTPAGVGYSYQWYRDNVMILGANSAAYVVADSARETAYNYTVVVTANAGCNVTAAAPAITVVADPQVAVTISNDIVCVGGTATLNAVVDGGVAGVNGLNGYTFNWYRNNTQLVGTGASYTTTGLEAAGNYTYRVEVISNYGCQTLSAPTTYVVVPDPAVNITRVVEYPATVCDGGSTALKANVTGGIGAITYQWFKNGNLIPGETNEVIFIDNLTYGTNDTYAVQVSQEGVGCSNGDTVAISSMVTVSPAYTVNISGFGNVCEGGTLTLNASVNGVIAGDVLSYQWFKIVNGENAIAISGATTAQYTTSDLLLGNSYDYYVVVTSNFSGCSVVSNSVPANVVPAPSVVINGANTVCEGGNLTLNAFINGGVDGTAYVYTWNWTGADTGSAVTTVPTYDVNLNASDYSAPYYFTVTISRADNTGCTATSAAHEVNILAAPTVTVTADNNYVCQNGDVTFTANVTPVGAYNYVWTINGQQQAVNTATITTNMSNVGAITASVVVSAANASSSCTASATIATPVQVVAAPTVTISADHLTMCVGGTTTLTANVTANGNVPGDFNYQWAINGIEVQGAVANTFVQPLNAAGVYTYTLRVSQDNNLGCNSTWSAPVTVQVAEQPVVTLSSQDGLSICEGGSVTLNAVVTNYSNNVNGVVNSNIYGNMTFNWISNGTVVYPHANVNTGSDVQTYTLNTIGNYNYQVSVDASGYNCQPQVSNIETVSVVGDPSWTDVHVIANNGTDVCLGEMVILQAAIQGGTTDGEGSTSGHIQWVVTDGQGNTVNVSGGLGGNSYDIPAVAGSYIYTPTYVGNIGSGCQLTNTGDVQVGVTVHELPTATFVSGDSTALCANDPSASAELVIAFTGVAPFVYEVVDASGNVVAHATTLANTATIYVAPATQTTYRINLIQDAYCVNTALDADATATVFVNDIQFEQTFFVAECDANNVTINFNMTAGNPTAAFSVVYENGQVENGNIINNTATFATPTVPGDYAAVFTVDGCSYDITIRVPMGSYNYTGTLPLMDQRWNDVVVVNCNPATNGGHTFVGFQWYHNGVAIPGATYSNYQDKDGLNGFYSVELIEQDANGNMITYITCEQYFNATSTVKVYPVPANVRQEITIELDLTSEELEGAVLDIFSVTGAHINHVVDLQPITKIEGFKAQGTYFGRILTGTNEIKTVKFVIVK